MVYLTKILFIFLVINIIEIECNAIRKVTEFSCSNTKNHVSTSLGNFRREFGEQIQSYMALDADPCENFYEYACGNWDSVRGYAKYQDLVTNFLIDVHDEVTAKLKEILDPTTDEHSEILKKFSGLPKAQKYYKSCINVDIYSNQRVPEYIEFLKKIGGFPAADPNWNATNFDWLKMLAYADIFKANIFFQTKISQAYPFNPVLIAQNDFGLESTVAITSNDIGMVDSRSYKSILRIMKHILRKYCQAADSTKCSESRIQEIADKALQFGENWLQSEDSSGNMDYSTTGDLINDFPNWEIFLKNRLQITEVDRSLKLNADSQLFASINNFTKTADPETFANVLSMKILYFLHGENRKPRFQQDFCINKLKTQFSHLIAEIYTEIYWNDEIDTDIMRMFIEIIEVMIELIHEAKWLDGETRENVLLKALTLTASIGYVRHPIVGTLAKFIAKNVNITDNFYDNNIQGWLLDGQLEIYYYLNNIDESVPSQSVLTSLDINSSYNFVLNSISMYAAIFHRPLYDKRFPNILKYGFVGETIGHEISHAFGNRSRNIFTMAADQEYNKRAECYVTQYNKFYFPEVDLRVDGEETLEENIADNLGLKLTLLAYNKYLEKNGYDCDQQPLAEIPLTNLQLFFVAHAQQYCTTYYRKTFIDEIDSNYPFMMVRVEGPLQNSNEFAKTFDCKVGSFMNPEKKCELF